MKLIPAIDLKDNKCVRLIQGKERSSKIYNEIFKDAVDYMLPASVSVRDVVAKDKSDLLFNRFQAARDVIEQYRTGPPYAYVIAQEQRDPVAAVERRRAYTPSARCSTRSG